MPTPLTPAAARAVALHMGDDVPEWVRAAGAVAVSLPGHGDAPGESDPGAALAAALAGAECVLLDADTLDPLAVARRVHRAEPEAQVVVVVDTEARRRALERAVVFAPGVGELWLASPHDVGGGITERAAGVTRQRRRFRRTRERMERERVEASPQRSERALISDAYLANLLQVLPDPVFSIDPAGRILSANPAAGRVLRPGDPELVGATLSAALGASDALVAHVLAAAADRPSSAAVTYRRADGSAGHGELLVARVAEGEPALFAVVLHDLTERHRAQQRLEEQAQELAGVNEQLQEQATEMEAQAEELQASVAELEERTAEAERAREALAESERQFRTLADAIPTLAWTARADGYLDWYNAQWYAYTGTTPADMEGWGWQAVHDPAVLPDVLALWQTSIATGEPFEMTFPLRGANGRFRAFLTRVTPVRDADGRVVRWFGTNTDVEGERAARAAAEAAAARAALLQDLTAALSQALTREPVSAVVVGRLAAALGAHLGVLALLTPEGDRLVMAAAERLWEETRRAWESFPLDAPVPLAEAARERRTVTLPTFDAIAEHAPTIAALCRDYGAEAICVVPLIASDGPVLGTLGLSFPTPRTFDADLVGLLETLAQQTAQALERARLFEAEQVARADAEAAEARLRDIFEQAPVAVAVLSGPEHVYTVVSPLYAASPGQGRPLLGRSVREAFPELEGTGYADAMDRVYETGVPYAAAERLVHLTGQAGVLEERYFNVGYQPLRDRTGRVYAIASVAYDVTDQVRARHEVEAARAEAERAREAAEEANRAKSEFLSTMSHELRTPLNAIGGYVELMTMGLRGPLNEAQLQDLERIRRANQHLMALVTDILNFARLEAGQVEFHVGEVALAAVIADLEPLVAPQLAAKGLTYRHAGCVANPPDQPHVVRTDPEKLRQVLLNLLTNAIKFTDAGGHIEVACESDPAAGVVHIRVTDTGRGIPADQLGRIFEPFVQVDRHRTHASQQGVGLGLAISRDLARGMGGDLTVDSTPGVGSSFTITLPRA